jgi:ubiquinone/menaquinone biosynthesis C-methylase UbiE
MDTSIRKPYQGIYNIIRFNWHFYALSVFFVVLVLIAKYYFNSFSIAADILVLLIACTVFISLSVSYYIYDLSDLYTLSWLDNLKKPGKEIIINIHAGFDETSQLLKNKFATAELQVADFYDPTKHTEVSIKRARKAYPAFPKTQQVNTGNLPMQDNSADKVFAILSAHEIRNEKERIAFFNELRRILKPSGEIVVTEHLRDTANFLAYNFGFFHFYSKSTWLHTFRSAKLTVSRQVKITPFITTFILEKNATAS